MSGPLAIEVEGLRKVYRRLRRADQLAVDGLDLHVPEGCVFGFLGPNGSGKTTTIRCLLGLVRPSAGRLAVLGRPVPEDLASVVGRIGTVVESSAFFPTMSGRRNLELLARLEGLSASRIDTALERAGLAERAGDQVRRYSLGMRQRLGLAAALLKDPALLVLDEPANGLDPAGIREIRLLLRELADEGRTIFVSSHLLAEVGQTCDHVAILRRGRCVAAGPVADVLGTGRTGAGLIVRVEDTSAAVAALSTAGLAVRVDDGVVRVAVPPAEAARVNRLLGAAGLWASELRPDEASLEELFLSLTEDEVEVAA
jgi:ABC-2 type transport system ATP-binding protein